MGRTVAARAAIEPFLVMEIVADALAQEARTGDVLHLEVGQPSTGAPKAARRRAIELLESGDPLGYTAACGIGPLRERISHLYRSRHGLLVDPARIIVTAGASGALTLALLSAFDPAERVAMAVPGYPCYRQIAEALGLVTESVRVGGDSNFLLSADLLAAVPDRPAGVIVAGPANPTGAVYDDTSLAALATWCTDRDVRLISDEIYHGITFGHPAPTALAHDPAAIVLGSFSKYFSMTGWRIGWMVVPEELADPIDRLSQNLYLSPPTLAQHAALAALDCGAELDSHVDRYRRNRDLLLATLTDLGVGEIAPCDGAFYLYGTIDHWGLDSPTLCRTWLHELGVAATPGVDFDPADGHRWVRWSLAGSTADISEAARRLRVWADHG